MRILQDYIAKTVLLTTVMALLLLVGIDLLFLTVQELRRVGDSSDYTVAVVFQYIALSVPKRLYFMFPMASLLGALMGLGLLASSNELVVMQASGISTSRIAWAVMRVALVLTLLLTAIGDVIAPKAEILAKNLRERALHGNNALWTPQGTWVRNGSDFILIRHILPGNRLTGIIRYQFDEHGLLQRAITANQAIYNVTRGTWLVQGVRQTQLIETGLKTKFSPEQEWKAFLEPQLLNVLVIDPDDLSLKGLVDYISYLKTNGLGYANYELEFWKKIFQPISAMVMVFITVPFIFGPLRSATMGLRLVSGIFVGFFFYLFNELFGPLSVVYAFPTWLAAAFPSLLFGFVGWLILRRT